MSIKPAPGDQIYDSKDNRFGNVFYDKRAKECYVDWTTRRPDGGKWECTYAKDGVLQGERYSIVEYQE